MRKTWIIVAVFLLVVLVFAGYYFSHSKKPRKDVTLVKAGNITENAVAVGYILPVHSIKVNSQISGTVFQLNHDEGDYVAKGEVLLTIKPRPTPSNIAEDKERLAEATVKEKKAKQDLRHYQALLKEKAIGINDQDYLKAKESYDTDVVQRRLAQQRLDLLEKGEAIVGGKVIGNKIRSPVSGYILQRLVDQGEPVAAQSDAQAGTTLFTIADMTKMEFKGQVSEMDAAKLKSGMVAAVELAAYPVDKIKGKVYKIALQSEYENKKTDPTGKTAATTDNNTPFANGFNVEIKDLVFPKNIKLKSGYSATATIAIKTVKHVLVVPERLVSFSGDHSFVYQLMPTGKPKKRKITLGLSNGIQAQVLTGLKLGDKILPSPTAGHA